MIDWADCTTVMIGWRSPKTFPCILNICVRQYMCTPVDVGAARKPMAGLRTRARNPKELLIKSRLKVLAWGENGINATLGGQHFGEPQLNDLFAKHGKPEIAPLESMQ